MKGIILAGGAGNRLYPMTKIQTKQLQAVYDKPMIYYPLSLLMLSGIKEILLITTEKDQPSFKELLGDGSHLGIKLEYIIQAAPKGIAEAFILGEDFIGGEDSVLILGDNLFYGNFDCFRKAVKKQLKAQDGIKGRIFAYSVKDPERYGVIDFDKKSGKVQSIEEKPNNPKSNYAIPGLYIFDKTVCDRAKKLEASPRGELEITSIMHSYLEDGELGYELINRGMAWFDTGTPQSMLEASAFIAAIEQRQGLKVACLEEIALNMNYLNLSEFRSSIEQIPNSSYKDYLKLVMKEHQ